MNILDHFFTAKSIAVIGASNHRAKVGHQVLRNLLASKTHREIYPINPTSQSILGLPVYPNLTAIKKPVDVVIIATPAETVGTLIDEIILRNSTFAASEKVKALVIISAGFAEVGEKGKQLQREIVAKLQAAGIALLGPNTLGFISATHQLNASFAQHDIPAGNLGIISQSGAILTALFDELQDLSCGISFAVSLGNEAGVTENNCLEFALDDPHTDVVLLYLESFSNLPHFFSLTSRLSKKKPVIVLKGGTSQRGQQASLSHTAALATNQVLLRAAAKQMGFVVVENIEQLVNLASFLAWQKHIPENVMVITNAGGPAVNTIDELTTAQVPLAQWSKQSQVSLNEYMPHIPPNNPLDLLGDADPKRFRAAIEIAQRDMHINAVLVIVTPQAMTDMSGIVHELLSIKGKKPLFVSLIGGAHLESLRQLLQHHHLLSPTYPNDTATTLHFLTQLNHAKYSPHEFWPEHRSDQSAPLPTLDETFHVLKNYGFHIPKYAIMNEENSHTLEKIPYPLFAKTANPALAHKKDLGAVFGIVHNHAEAQHAYSILQKFGSKVLFQEVIEPGTEILLGAVNDPQFGWYMTIGLGGSDANLLADRSYAFLPTTQKQLMETWLRTKAATLFANKPEQVKHILEYMTDFQRLLIENPWIKELEINPLTINETGLWVLDVK